MSFKPDLNSLHECINFNSNLKDTSASFPFSPRSTYGESFRAHSSKARNSHDETYMRTLMKPGTAKGGRTPIKMRESSRLGQRPKKRVDFSVLDEGLSYRTNNNLCQSQRSDVTEPEEKPEERSPIVASTIHRINGRGEITRMSVPHPKTRIRTGSAHPKQNTPSHREYEQNQEKPVVQDPIIEKFQNNYQRLRKNIVKLTTKQKQQSSPEKIPDEINNNNETGFITKLSPSSPIRYEGARHSLIIKSEDPKAPYVSDIEKSLQTDVSNSPRKQRFTYRKPSINTRPEVETLSTLQSPKVLNLQGVKPFKVYVLSEDTKRGGETPQRPMSVQRAHKKVVPYDSSARENSTSGDEIPASSKGFQDQETKKIAALLPKDIEYCRMRSIRNYIIQKKNLHFYSFTPKEYLNYKAIASMIAQGNPNITVIPQETFASSFYTGTPKIDAPNNTGTKWFTKELESDLLTRSLVLGPPEKKKPVLISTRPGTSQDRVKARREQQEQEVRSSSFSPFKEKVKFISPGKTREKREKSHNFKKGFLLPREIDNFELEGWDHKTEESV